MQEVKYNIRSNHRRSDPAIQPSEIRPSNPTTGDPSQQSNHRRSDPAIQPPEIRPSNPTIGDPSQQSNHRRSDPAIQPPEIRHLGLTTGDETRGPTIGDPTLRSNLSTVWQPGSHSLRYGHRGAVLCDTATGEPIYREWSPRSRS